MTPSDSLPGRESVSFVPSRISEFESRYSESSVALSIASNSLMYPIPRWSPLYPVLLPELFPMHFLNLRHPGSPPLHSLMVWSSRSSDVMMVMSFSHHRRRRGDVPIQQWPPARPVQLQVHCTVGTSSRSSVGSLPSLPSSACFRRGPWSCRCRGDPLKSSSA